MSGNSSNVDISGASQYMLAPPPPPNPFIVTLEELLASHSAVTQKESEDRAEVSRFLLPEGDDIRPKLFEWANKGFPTIYPLRSISLTPPVTCSDGQVRNTVQYTEFLRGNSISQSVSTLQGKMPGLEVTFSHSATNLTLHVSRDSS